MSAKKKIVFIGPVFPYRGGIAQHSTMVARELADLSELLVLSFSRQYPKFLYPGETDQDSTYVDCSEENTEYMIDSLNPFTWQKAVNKVLDFGAEKVILPWWTIYFVPCFSYMLVQFRRKKIDIVFICHNVIEHESSIWKKKLSEAVLKMGSAFIVHSNTDRENLLEFLPDAKVNMHHHPLYDHFPLPRGEFERRKSLELLCYGFIRPYKGIDILVDAMSRVKRDDVQLTIAGEAWYEGDAIHTKVTELDLEDKIELRLYYHSDQETAELFSRADIVVLPYRSATGSGVIPIAYYYNKPVLVTKVGGLVDVVEECVTGIFVPPENPELLAAAIDRLSSEECNAMSMNINQYIKDWTWESFAGKLLELHG